MKLTVLVDNNTLIDHYFYGEPGVSYLIESGGTKVLFDLGYSDIFIRNAQSMEIDLLDIVCNIIKEAMHVCNCNRVVDVIGGLHLMNPPEDQIRRTAEYLKGLELNALHACHCTDLMSKSRLAIEAPLMEVGVGLELEYH